MEVVLLGAAGIAVVAGLVGVVIGTLHQGRIIGRKKGPPSAAPR